MMKPPTSFSVFTKFWNLPLTELAATLRRAGADGAELPVRSGYAVEPDTIEQGLLEASRVFADEGLRVFSIAPPLEPVTERTIAACAAAGIKIIRVMVRIGGEGYLAAETAACHYFQRLAPALQEHGVTLGVQNHCDHFVANAAGLRRIVERFDPLQIGAVYDVGHCALDGELPALAVDLLWSHLAMVNLKNAVWVRTNGAEAPYARWKKRIVAGNEGIAAWPDVAAELHRRNWSGIATICAEYDDLDAKDELLDRDLSFARELFSARKTPAHDHAGSTRAR